MIKFFRKIRHKLLSEGKTSKYLKYAVGEIILVVLGILIALQINNWNTDRKNTIREKQLLREMAVNLNSNLTAFDQNIVEQSEYIRRIDTIIDYLENKKPYHDSLSYHLKSLKYIEEITASSSTYETLKSTGLDLVKSNLLRIEITQLYEMVYPVKINLIRDVTMKHYDQSQSMFNKYLRTNKATTRSEPNDYDALLQDQTFINWLFERRSWKMGVVGINKGLMDETKLLLASINSYLENQ